MTWPKDLPNFPPPPFEDAIQSGSPIASSFSYPVASLATTHSDSPMRSLTDLLNRYADVQPQGQPSCLSTPSTASSETASFEQIESTEVHSPQSPIRLRERTSGTATQTNKAPPALAKELAGSTLSVVFPSIGSTIPVGDGALHPKNASNEPMLGINLPPRKKGLSISIRGLLPSRSNHTQEKSQTRSSPSGPYQSSFFKSTASVLTPHAVEPPPAMPSSVSPTTDANLRGKRFVQTSGKETSKRESNDDWEILIESEEVPKVPTVVYTNVPSRHSTQKQPPSPSRAMFAKRNTSQSPTRPSPAVLSTTHVPESRPIGKTGVVPYPVDIQPPPQTSPLYPRDKKVPPPLQYNMGSSRHHAPCLSPSTSGASSPLKTPNLTKSRKLPGPLSSNSLKKSAQVATSSPLSGSWKMEDVREPASPAILDRAIRTPLPHSPIDSSPPPAYYQTPARRSPIRTTATGYPADNKVSLNSKSPSPPPPVVTKLAKSPEQLPAATPTKVTSRAGHPPDLSDDDIILYRHSPQPQRGHSRRASIPPSRVAVDSVYYNEPYTPTPNSCPEGNLIDLGEDPVSPVSTPAVGSYLADLSNELSSDLSPFSTDVEDSQSSSGRRTHSNSTESFLGDATELTTASTEPTILDASTLGSSSGRHTRSNSTNSFLGDATELETLNTEQTIPEPPTFESSPGPGRHTRSNSSNSFLGDATELTTPSTEQTIFAPPAYKSSSGRHSYSNSTDSFLGDATEIVTQPPPTTIPQVSTPKVEDAPKQFVLSMDRTQIDTSNLTVEQLLAQINAVGLSNLEEEVRVPF